MADPNTDAVAARLEAEHAKRKRDDTMDDLRLAVKIMAHDLESTRRERDALKGLFNHWRKGDSPPC